MNNPVVWLATHCESIAGDRSARTTKVGDGTRGTPTQGAEIQHNWFYIDDTSKAIGVYETVTEKVTISDNAFVPVPPPGTCLPIAKATATPVEGKVPLTVAFDSAGSAFVEGTLVSYSWDFGDVVLFGGAVGNGTFETDTDWTYSENGSVWEGWPVSEDVWTGRRAHMLQLPYNSTTDAGSWAQIVQTVSVTQ